MVQQSISMLRIVLNVIGGFNFYLNHEQLNKFNKEVEKISNFYVPVNYSNLKEIISENDEILYSTLCKVKREIGYKFKSHLLITKEGFAYKKSLKKGQNEPIFRKWFNGHGDDTTQFKNDKFY